MIQRKTIMLIWLLSIVVTVVAQKDNSGDKLKLEINKNVELLGLAYFIGFEGVDIEKKTVEIGGEQIPKNVWHNYGFEIYERYKSFSSSTNLATAFSIADHLWLDYILGLLLQVEEFPNAILHAEIEEKYYNRFSITGDIEEAKVKAKTFLDGMNAFGKEINFDQYLDDNKPFYNASLNQIRDNLPDAGFIEAIEEFYGQQFTSYTLIPSLAIPKGMGFGLRYTTEEGKHVFNVFGAFDFQKFDDISQLDMGFGSPQGLRELSIHEFGHSFVNPVVDLVDEEKISSTDRLFEPIRSSMADQGYTSWKSCLYEHFVRAGEVIIASKIGNEGDADRLYSLYVDERKFRYLPVIIAELKKYSQDDSVTYQEAVENSLDQLAKLQ